MDSGGATGGGPAPFLLKTYDMVDDSSNVDVVSWTTSGASFVVWNPPEFASRLLPSYFKHNNFSSFIRQLNTYGFRKIHPERWEFANEDFIQGQKHLLKNIHRRKPIHSHSNTPDHERAALEEEIDRLGREKAALQADLWRFRQHQPGTKAQLDGLDHRLHDMEQRQEKMVAFFQRAVQDQGFVEALVKMAAAGSLDLPAIHKKRRLPGSGQPQEIIDNDVDDSPPKNEIGMVFHRDFCDKLKLELSPAISECNLVSAITQNSNGGRESPQGKLQVRMECLPLVPETLELSDTGTSFCSRKSIFCSGTAEEREGVLPFHLSLTLASSSMQVDVDGCSEEQRMGNGIELRARSEERDANVCKLVEKNQVNVDVDNCANVRELAQSNSPATAAAATTGRVNDMFWEQFLTEKPVSLETAEASSCLPPNSSEQQQEERMAGNESV